VSIVTFDPLLSSSWSIGFLFDPVGHGIDSPKDGNDTHTNLFAMKTLRHLSQIAIQRLLSNSSQVASWSMQW
jgi:hypothetical protein